MSKRIDEIGREFDADSIDIELTNKINFPINTKKECAGCEELDCQECCEHGDILDHGYCIDCGEYVGHNFDEDAWKGYD